MSASVAIICTLSDPGLAWDADFQRPVSPRQLRSLVEGDGALEVKRSVQITASGSIWSRLEAHGFFDRALTADPDNVDALVGSARASVVDGASSFGTNPTLAFTSAEAKLTKALSSVPDRRGRRFVGL
jgi:hypothetical protein